MNAYFKNKLFLIGLLLAVLGCGPLLAIILLSGIGLWPDPNPNPIGPGLLFFLTCWPAAIFLLAGVFSVRRARFRERLEQGGSMTPRKHVDSTTRPVLTAEQETYVRSIGLGTGWGLIYFVFMGVTGQFFKHLPANFVWTHTMRNGRRYAWEGRTWQSFDEYKRKNDQIDAAALPILIIGIFLVVILLLI